MASANKKTPKKRYLIIHMGGTIGMVKDQKDRGFRPPENTAEYESSVKSIIGKFIKYHKNIAFDFLLLSTVDSNDMNAETMEELAAIVHSVQAKYDGILITHGTDTLASTAAAMNLAFQTPGGASNLHTPLILTGAQKSIHEMPTDAVGNLLLAFNALLSLSNDTYFPGVFVAFGGLLIDGAYVIKAHESAYDAFAPTVQSALLGKADSHDAFGITFENLFLSQGISPAKREQLLLDITGPLPAGRFLISPLNRCGSPQLSYIHTTESSTFGSPQSYMPQAADEKCLGIVFKLTGIGSTGSKNFQPVKEIVTAFGMPVFGALGIAGGKPDMTVYEIGNAAYQSGMLPARVTFDAALVQLQWCLAQSHNADDLFQLALIMSGYTSLTSMNRGHTHMVVGSTPSASREFQLPEVYLKNMGPHSDFNRRVRLSQQQVDAYRLYKGANFRFLNVPRELAEEAGQYLPNASEYRQLSAQEIAAIQQETGWTRIEVH